MKSNFLISLGLALLSLVVGPGYMRAASLDFSARIWDATTGRELTVLRGHTDAVRSAAFSPDGKRIVTASEDETARIWDAAKGRNRGPARTRIAVRPPPSAPTGSASSRRHMTRPRASGTPRRARNSWSCADARTPCYLPPSAPTASASSRHQTTAPRASGTPQRARRLTILRGHEGDVQSAAFSPDGTRIVTASVDETARIWDADDGQGTHRPARPQGQCRVRRLQPRREADRHGGG